VISDLRSHGRGRRFDPSSAHPVFLLHQLRRLGGHLYVCGGSLQPFKVNREDLIFDDLPIVEYLTFMSVMERTDLHLYI
jgi:predicted peroxiredoxin